MHRSSFSVFRDFVLLMALAGLAAPGCSSDDTGPMVYVDVSLAPGLAAPAKVQLQVVQLQSAVTTKVFDWPTGAAVLKAGVGLPKDSSGNVSVKATGLDSLGTAVSAGTSAEAPISSAFTVVLSATALTILDGGTDAIQPGNDGATQDLAIDRTSGGDGPTVDLAAPDQAPPGDGPTADKASDAAGIDGPGLDHDGGLDAPPAIDGPTSDGLTGVDIGIDAGAGRAWSAPSQRDPDNGGEPGLAVDPTTGNAVVVWADTAMGVSAVRYTASTGSWSSSISISSDVNISVAKVAVDAKGHYLVVWSKRGDNKDATTPGIWASFSNDGSAWSKPTQLFAGGADNYDPTESLHLAMNRSGQAMVVWHHSQSPRSSESEQQLYSVYLEGTAPRPAVVVASMIGLSDYEPTVAIDGSGNGIITWADATSSPEKIMAATFAKQTVAAPMVLMSSDSNLYSPVVAMNEPGQGIVVWGRLLSAASSYVHEFHASRYSSTGSWSAEPEQVARANSTGSIKSVVLDNYGTAHLAWARSGAAGWQTTVSSQPIGGTWSTQALEDDNLWTARYVEISEPEPVLALDGSGNLLAAWRKKVSDLEVTANLRWRIGDTWQPVTQLGLVPDLFIWNVKVGATDDGRALAAWHYYHCDPDWRYASDVCPNAKTTDKVSVESKAAWGKIYTSIYR